MPVRNYFSGNHVRYAIKVKTRIVIKKRIVCNLISDHHRLNLQHKKNGGVSELVFGPYAAMASGSEMLMFNTYTALSETFAALPTNQILPSDLTPESFDTAPKDGIITRAI